MAGEEWWAGLPLVAGEEPGAGLSVPGAVGVPGQAAVGAVSAIQLAALQRHLGYAHLAGHKQLLLHTTEEENQDCTRFPPNIIVENEAHDNKL